MYTYTCMQFYFGAIQSLLFLINAVALQAWWEVCWYLWSSVFVVWLKAFSPHTSGFSTVSTTCREHEIIADIYTQHWTDHQLKVRLLCKSNVGSDRGQKFRCLMLMDLRSCVNADIKANLPPWVFQGFLSEESTCCSWVSSYPFSLQS